VIIRRNEPEAVIVPIKEYEHMRRQADLLEDMQIAKVIKERVLDKKELIEFIEQMNTKQFADVQKFFDTMPRLTHTVKIENPKTKKESEIVLTGLNDFFG